MTYSSITRHRQSVQFSRCLEIGPGPGTWTRVLFRNHQSAEFKDKRQFAARIADLLVSGAEGCLITKNPQRWRLRNLIGLRDSRRQHQGQIAVRALKPILEGAGFFRVKFYPAVIRLPLGRLTSHFGLGIGVERATVRAFVQTATVVGATMAARADGELCRALQETLTSY